jgi:CMP-N-acetylneuraminic acid synthetase
MKIVGFVPSKLNSERVPGKNIRPLAGIPLVNYVLRTLNKVKDVEETIIFASEPSITGYVEKGLKYKFIKRPEYLDTQEAKAQDFIAEFLKADKAGIIVLLHITSPFIKAKTVEDCLQQVVSGKYDSAFAALALRKFCWFKGSPLNYSLGQPTPRTQDLEHLIVEQSGLYVFRRELFEKTRQRVSPRPYIRIVDDHEGHDIDTSEDFEMAELIARSRRIEE